jgi:hypothetical protein
MLNNSVGGFYYEKQRTLCKHGSVPSTALCRGFNLDKTDMQLFKKVLFILIIYIYVQSITIYSHSYFTLFCTVEDCLL